MTAIDKNKYTFSKEEKLCYQKSIDRIFEKGKSFIAYPLRVVYHVEKEEDTEKQLAKVLISVPKRKFKRANKRNRIKRLTREAYRLNKSELLAFLQERGISIDIALIYLDAELPTFEIVEKAIKKTITSLKNKLKEDEKAID